jgi:hypothetical protein
MYWEDAGMKLVNVLFAVFLALILASSFERLHRCQPVSPNKVVATLMLGFCLARLSQCYAVAGVF